MRKMSIFRYVTVGAVCLICAAVRGQDFRTDINPALRYYQSFIMSHDMAPADNDYLFTNQWRGQKLPQKFGDLISGYHNQFAYARQAAQATVPCDWGIDLSAGPETLLPHLARCKNLAQLLRFNVMWELQNGNESGARDDLVAAFALGRNTAQDGTLIGGLVQIAIESIIFDTVAENYFALSGATLQELETGFNSAPPYGTMSRAILTGEKSCSHLWLERKIVQWQQENPGDDAKVMARLKELFKSFSDDSGANQWQDVLKVAKNSDGVLKMARDMDPYYDQVAQLFMLPYAQFVAQAPQFEQSIKESANPMLKISIPAVLKSRQKEFSLQARTAMLHAAIEYKVHGEAALRSVNDPLFDTPFQYERFIYQGVDRGFKLTSSFTGRGFTEAMIFVESDGPAFNCDGKNAGQPTN